MTSRWRVAGAVMAMLTPLALAAPAAEPPAILAASRIEPAVATPADWLDRRAPELRAAFQREIFGQLPALPAAQVTQREKLRLPRIEAIAHVEQWRIDLGPDRFHMVVVMPKAAPAPAPVIVMQLFCGNRVAFPGRPRVVAETLTPVTLPCRHGVFDPLVTSFLGQAINGPPFETVLSRGYAIAMFYPGDVVADDPAAAAPVLQRLATRDRSAPGVLAVWAQLYSRAYDVLAADRRIDAQRIAIWGHSRHGKAALLAGAFDHRFAAVIAHQAGRYGAAMTRDHSGERPDQILTTYPHWFTPGLRADARLSVDQHELIALNAPTPVLLGNGADDDWSDPPGVFRAAREASPIYTLLGARGIDEVVIGDTPLSGDISFFARPGRHGVTTQDWSRFLDFLDAHLR